MRSGANIASAGEGLLPSRWLAPALMLILLIVTSAVAGSPAALAGPGDRAGTEISMKTPRQLMPFAVTTKLTARVSPVEPGQGEVAGSVQFRVDGLDFGEPVPVDDGIAATHLSGLSAGDHDLRAYFKGSSGFSPSRASFLLSVDSPPPGPAGILPCADRSVVLTAAYRLGKKVLFEGVARYSLRGETVQIRTARRSVTSAKVRSDGTFWASSANSDGDFTGRTRFHALVNGNRSWDRRLGQAVSIMKRTPQGQERAGANPTIEARISKGGSRRVVLARQVGCQKQKTVPIKQVGSEPNGNIRLSMPRPDKSEPYVIYRLLVGGGKPISSPIVVRSAD